MLTVFILGLSSFLIAMFIVFNFKKQKSIANKGNEHVFEQSKSKFPIVMVVLFIILAAGLATYTAMQTIMSNH